MKLLSKISMVFLFRIAFDRFSVDDWQDYNERFANGRKVIRIAASTYDWQTCA